MSTNLSEDAWPGDDDPYNHDEISLDDERDEHESNLRRRLQTAERALLKAEAEVLRFAGARGRTASHLQDLVDSAAERVDGLEREIARVVRTPVKMEYRR